VGMAVCVHPSSDGSYFPRIDVVGSS